MKDLRGRTIRGGVAKLCAQGANFVIRLGSLMVIARLLRPEDYGVVGMATAFTGVFGLFRDFGLSAAAVQRADVTPSQSSTLFWINLVVGSVLGLLTAALAPALAAFYHEPRLVAVTIVLATGFIFNAAGVQHNVLLQRELRFTILALISTISLIVSTAVGVGGALAGYGYWALVAMAVTLPLANTIGTWLVTRWVPTKPEPLAAVRSMMSFGGALTFNGLVYYAASNLDKVLIGRFWGVDALGVYGRAYQLISIPTENLNSAAGDVAFSALSRLQADTKRFKSYFVKGYSLILTMTLPVTMACAVFADDIVAVLLGPKWNEVAPIFRLLAPTILAFAMVNPLGWLLISLGLVRRSLNMALAIAPAMVIAYLIGLSRGPGAVALAYSVVMLLWVCPAIAWAIRGTVISARDVFDAVSRPLAASIIAAGIAWGVRSSYLQPFAPVPRLFVEIAVLVVCFVAVIVFDAKQKSMYLDLFRELTRSSKQKDAPSRVPTV